MLEGIDLSEAQSSFGDKTTSSVRWSLLAGIDLVYARASDGVGWEDPTFASHAAGAHANGFPFGPYHFLRVRHGRAQDAAQQIRDFFKIAEASGFSLAPMLDCEPVGNPRDEHDLATDSEWADAVSEAFAECVRCFGALPIVYASPSFLLDHPKFSQAACTLPLWVAHYTSAPAPIVPKPWADWLAWQYAGSSPGFVGQVPGVAGPVDRTHWKELPSV